MARKLEVSVERTVVGALLDALVRFFEEPREEGGGGWDEEDGEVFIVAVGLVVILLSGL